MRKGIRLLPAVFGALAMLTLILDGKTALLSAQAGVELCLRTVVPSLFPFFVLSGMVSSALLGRKIAILRPVGRLCRIPEGSESLLLLGLIAGYPVGAQMIADAHRQGNLSKKDMNRMLGFCCNAGPAFLFGMLSPLFVEKLVLWALWAVHIISALTTGIILPGGGDNAVRIPNNTPLTLSESLSKGVKTMGLVCGWVVVFRVLLEFCNRWFLWVLPISVRVLVSGVLELSNGCVQLSQLSSEGMRFVFAGLFLSVGGVCVWMQTKSVTAQTGTGWYLLGKALQCLISLFLCLAVQGVLFPPEERLLLPVTLPIIVTAAALAAFFIRRKLGMEKKVKMLYNIKNLSTKETGYAITQEH